MSVHNRREFLKKTGVGAVAAGSLTWPLGGCRAGEQAPNDAIPPHRPIHLEGLHAYAQHSIRADHTLQIRLSSSVPYQLSICRLGHDIDNVESVESLHEFEASPAAPLPIHPGSYVHIPQNLPADQPLRAFSLECWVRLWMSGRRQGLITQFDSPGAAGIGLLVDEENRVQCYVGDGGGYRAQWIHTGPAIELQKWHHAVCTWDGKTVSLWLDATRVYQAQSDASAVPGPAPLRIGASGLDGRADQFLDGDLAMPVIHARALEEAQVRRRFEAQALRLPEGGDVMACWPLQEERGADVADISPHQRHGRIVNNGTWMIGGPSFDPHAIPRYDLGYDPAKDAGRGHGLRLASDDLYDCRWPVVHSWQPPAGATPGFYAARFRYELDGEPQIYDATFVLRRASSRPRPEILVLCSSSTWLAYNTTPFQRNAYPPQSIGTSGGPNLPDAPGYSMYLNHHQGKGQPAYQVGLRVPWPAAGPYVHYGEIAAGYSHLVRAERFLQAWLQQQGYDFDVATDQDLDEDPEMPAPYHAVILNGHSEYWTEAALLGLDRYLRGGGNLAVFSGNTMFWRVSLDAATGMMECRKFGGNIGGRGGAAVGELWHSLDHQRGSLMRETKSLPAWRLIGAESVGWLQPDHKVFGRYVVRTPDHFLFREPERLDLKAGDEFGHGPGGSPPRAIGHEGDVRLSLLAAIQTDPPPEGAQMPEEPSGIVTLADGLVESQNRATYFDFFTRTVNPSPELRIAGQMIFWERPEGGRVFHTGAIAAGHTLTADPKLAALFRNVLHHFGVRRG